MKLNVFQEVENINRLAGLRKWKGDCKIYLLSEHQAQMILMAKLCLSIKEELNPLLFFPST